MSARNNVFFANRSFGAPPFVIAAARRAFSAAKERPASSPRSCGKSRCGKTRLQRLCVQNSPRGSNRKIGGVDTEGRALENEGMNLIIQTTPIFSSSIAEAAMPAEKSSSPSLAAFVARALATPEASDGAEKWSAIGPFSPRLDIARLAQTIERAASLEELADIAVQALNPGPRHARGASAECCMTAWRLWAMVEWTVTATPDALRALRDVKWDETPEFNPESVEVLAPEQFAKLQWRAAKGLLAALALPDDFEGLANAVARFHANLETDFKAWASQNAPLLVQKVYWSTRSRVLLDRADGEVFQEGAPDWSMRPLANAILGKDLSEILSSLLKAPENCSEKEFAAYCAEQNYFWRQEANLAASMGMSGLSGSDAKAQKALDERLPDGRQSLEGIAAELANRFGLRSVAIHPVGGAHRAKKELIRAFGAFSTLSELSGLPAQSLGLGGMRVVAGIGYWAQGREQNTAAHFEAKDFLSGEKSGAMSFTAPLRFLAHEWTHGWDFALRVNLEGLVSDEEKSALSHAREKLEQITRFEEPVSAATTRGYWRWREQPEKKRFFDYFFGSEELLAQSLKARGTETSKALVKGSRLPRQIRKQIQAIWPVAQHGSEKQIREKALEFAKNWSVLSDERITPEKWAFETALILLRERGALQARWLDMQKNKNWGPMRWEAAFMDKERKSSYWLAPHELLARAAERFMMPESGDSNPSLSFIPQRTGSRMTRPWGEEAERSNKGFEVFFATARPAFEALASRCAERGLAVSMARENGTAPAFDANAAALPGRLLSSNLRDFKAASEAKSADKPPVPKSKRSNGLVC